MIWFPIIIGLFLIYVGSIHYGSIAVGFDVPEMTLTFKQMVIEVVKNLFEEAGILGGVLAAPIFNAVSSEKI
ncbi:CPBP family intramembrane metalloprotease OS=Lysinibacillus sphaericus OX=1421 GN=LYSIN_02280 PE=4 SV=1 [Lysinibacillus sphaericus]